MGVDNMALTEQEELEMLELEKEQAMAQASTMQGKDPYGRPIARNEVLREEYPSEKFARYAEPISQFGGAFAKKAPIGAGLAGAATMGAEIARQGIQAIGSEPGAPRTFAESGGRIASAFGRGAIGEALGRGVIGGAGKVFESAAPTAQKLGAQIVRVGTGVPEREALAVIKDPSILSRAKSVSEAGENYANAINPKITKTVEGIPRASLIPGEDTARVLPNAPLEGPISEYTNIAKAETPEVLKSAGEGSRAAFGETMLSPEATLKKYDSLRDQMSNGSLDLQSALALRQTASHHIAKSKNDWFEAPLIEVMNDADKYIEKRLLEFPAAKKAYREAKVAEEFGSWLPLNKNLSPNVLRTAGALTYAAHGASEGRIVPMLMALGVSPKIWGYGIRAGAAVAKPVIGASKIGARLGSQGIANQVLPSSTEELMRRHYERQK